MKDLKIREVITGMEDDVHYSFMLVNLDKLTDEEKESLIYEVEFTIEKNATGEDGKPCWKLVDEQGANLGNIEEDEFEIGDYNGMIDRLDIYWRDYGYLFETEFTKEEIENFKFI